MLVAHKVNSLEVYEIISIGSTNSAHKFADTNSSDIKSSLVCLNSSVTSFLDLSNDDDYCMLSNLQNLKKDSKSLE